jgi:hypothetical protein
MSGMEWMKVRSRGSLDAALGRSTQGGTAASLWCSSETLSVDQLLSFHCVNVLE